MTKDDVDNARAAAKSHLDAGDITPRIYYGFLVQFAWDYIVARTPKDGLNCLMAIPSGYLRDHLFEDGLQRRELGEAAYLLSAWMVKEQIADQPQENQMLQLVREPGKA